MYTIILPEMTVMITVSQRIEAQKVSHGPALQRAGCGKTTLAQGFFISMGGLSFKTRVYGHGP